MFKNYFATGSIFCGIAVLLGAFGAHALKSILTSESLQSFQTAVQYQMLHGIAILIVGLISEKIKKRTWLLFHNCFLWELSFFQVLSICFPF